MPDRRSFIGSLGYPAAAAALSVSPALLERLTASRGPALPGASGDGGPDDEPFWAEVQRAFTVDRSLINLNNGGVSPSPAYVQDAMKRHLDFSNQAPTWTMWRVLEPQLETVRTMLADRFGCDAEEIAITRNASESLQICQLGFELRRGDQVVTTTQDYPRMITTWQQRERREGIELIQIEIPVPSEDPAEIVRRFEAAITTRTRVIHICHMINLTGQILPVRDVVRMARRRGIPVIVDGAHAFGHFVFSHTDLECDYYATSLHKWLFAPHGTGMLYVKRDRIADLWPLQAANPEQDANIRKFEEIGTHPAANHNAIAEAIVFSDAIGALRKQERLIYLRDRWAVPLARLDRVRLLTSMRPGFACGIATVAVHGIDPGDLAAHLWSRHRIIVSPIGHPEVSGIRVSPSVYTTLDEIDRFTEAMAQVARHGLPAQGEA
ncbi:MAG TPA: aminotransferase class V-fold PLP-dependent enzyme [Longimicrobiales bacterium]|nr:aminotransferase class V-fold PLP-dependent enzyme [Longimicrobiales bacterium]